METYTPEEVKQILSMLHTIRIKKNKSGEPTRLEKQIKYLEQRLKFFNPTREMLGYLINQAEKTKQKMDPVLLRKLREEYTKKQFD